MTPGNAGTAPSGAFDFTDAIAAMERKLAVELVEIKAWRDRLGPHQCQLAGVLSQSLSHLQKTGGSAGDEGATPIAAVVGPETVLASFGDVPSAIPPASTQKLDVKLPPTLTPDVKRFYEAVAAYMEAHRCSRVEAFIAVRKIDPARA